MTDTQRIAEIQAAWEYDMTHPYRANQKLDGKGYVAQWIDGHTESRSQEECDRNPFNVRANHSDLSSIGFLLAQLDQSQHEVERLHGVLDVYNAAADKFITNVECGAARSVETYRDLKHARENARQALQGGESHG